MLASEELPQFQISQTQQKKEGFQLIWYYWYLKYFANKPTKQQKKSYQQKDKLSHSKTKKSQSLQQQFPTPTKAMQTKKPLTLSTINLLIKPFKQLYHMQTIETHLEHNLNTIKERALLSRNDRFFVIEPQQEIRDIQMLIRQSSVAMKVNQPIETCLEEMIIELYSYYLNSKNVYVIYKSTQHHLSLMSNYENKSMTSSIDSAQNRLKMILTHNSSESRLNTSKDSKGSLKNERNESRSYGSLKSSLIMMNGANNLNNSSNNEGNTNKNHSKLLEEDFIIMNNIESIIGDGDKLDNKIQDMEVVDKMSEFDGLQLWNIKYKKIPHTLIKFKKQSWTKCINLPLMHPSAPKTIDQYPILPRINKLNPSIDKLLPFVSYVKLLEQYFPNFLPSIDSIFQYNNLPYVFVEEDNGYGSWKWQTNIGVLCYYVVYGNEQGTLSVRMVQRWVQQNGQTLLAKTIKEMTKRQKEKSKKRKQLLKTIGNTNSTNPNDQSETKQPNTTETSYTHSNTQSSSLQMLITKDENSDLAIW